MAHHESMLLGRHAGSTRFPLMVKFLDAERQLSVQVHPKDPVQHADGLMQRGKAEAWVVLDAAPESRMLLGLTPLATEKELRAAIADGTLEHLLQDYHPRRGDFIFLPPGTIHSLGGGILIAEVQQPSDITYRLYDWDRFDSQGRRRELHVEAAVHGTDFFAPPVLPRPEDSQLLQEELLSCPFFIVHRRRGPSCWNLPQDRRLHVIVMLAGTAMLEHDREESLRPGQTIVLPATRRPTQARLDEDCILLDVFLPDPHELQASDR
jgi:mannose-6-phosphate isomerase